MESIWLGGWGGRGGGDNNVHARLRNYVMLRWWNVLARWQLYVVTAHGKYMIGGWGGVGGWDNNVHARLRNYVMLRWWNVLARWQLYVVTAHGKYMIGGVGWGGIITSMHACGTMWCCVDGMCLHAGSSTWSPHMESIWLGGWGGGVGWDNNVHARLRNYVMLQIDRCWNHLKKIAPVKWRTSLAQQSMLGSGIESINGSIATTCPSET